MSRGNITRRGKKSWRLKFDVDLGTDGRRKTRFVTVKGTRQEAQKELTRLLGAADAGTLPEPSRATIAEHLRTWLDAAQGLSLKTAERFRQLAEMQIIPHIGTIIVQKLGPDDVATWHATLLARGSKDGRPLSARTVGHAHRVLHQALQQAVARRKLACNIASLVKPPRVEQEEVTILTPEQVDFVLDKLERHRLYPISALALATGMRRGELLATRICDVDLDKATVRVERSLQETGSGLHFRLRFKAPKSKHGKRIVSLPPSAVAVLRAHLRGLLELRMALGMGKPDGETLLFSKPDGSPLSPDNLSRDWRRACKSLCLPLVMFHALRHTHASALIASKQLDVVQISRRLGHGSPVITLETYAHLFRTADGAAAEAAEGLFRRRR